MPELPDLECYVGALERRVVGSTLEGVRLASPFVLRSVLPPLAEAFGRRVIGVERLGKRLVLALEGEVFLVIHLMISGRLHWKARGVGLPKKRALAAFDFPSGSLLLTEASSKKRASLHLVAGRAGLAEHDRGGVEPLAMDLDQLRAALGAERHTLKRSLTDPRLFSGIGNAYSDEILHRAGLSPFALSDALDDEQLARLYEAIRAVLGEWMVRLREQTGDGFPEKVTAFRPEMAVHGRFGKPCPVCATPVQRIVYAEREANYCPTCQTGGRLLADRALSQLLRSDWPKTLEQLEERRKSAREAAPTS